MRRRKAFTLIELLVVVAIIALLISILLPSLARARELSKRTVCSANVRGVGQACKIYSQENEEFWPTVETTSGQVSYIENIGRDRDMINNESSSSVSTTRNFWMLIRNGDITVKLMRCPSSNESMDDTENLNLYYDFKGSDYVSYGYQIPYPAPDASRPSEDMDPRMVLVGDRGPFTYASDSGDPWESVFQDIPEVPWDTPRNEMNRDRHQIVNSPNHGGARNGDGQNALFQDGHVEFTQDGFQGVDNDHMYTRLYIQSAFTSMPFGKGPGDNKRPGEDSLGAGKHSSTDSMIYP